MAQTSRNPDARTSDARDPDTRSAAWTPPRDAALRRLRQEGAGWEAIGAALGVTPDMARERGRRIGAPRPPQRQAPDAAADAADEPARAPLPPGHPRAWGVLTAGTALAGTAWPGWG